ncbi:MAG: class I SAM-dependent methyltransferase [Methanoregula sp.]
MRCIPFDRYIDCFHILEKYSEEYPFMLRHFLDTTARHFPEGFSLLDIGAGTGLFARAFLSKSPVPVRSYTAIEPSPDHVRTLFENLRNLPVETTIIPDYFTPETRTGKKYDIVLLSHSTYCFLPDPEPYLLHALSLLEDDGRAVFYQGCPTNFCTFLNLLYRDVLPEERVTDPLFTSWDVRDILEKKQVPHAVTYLPGSLRAGEIFLPENEQLFNDLITFSFMVEADSLPPGMLARSKEILQEIAYPSANGPLLNLGVDAIVTGLA